MTFERIVRGNASFLFGQKIKAYLRNGAQPIRGEGSGQTIKLDMEDFAWRIVCRCKSEVGLHTFVLSVSEWIGKTKVIGLFVKRGKYGGTYAYKDIAFGFASAIRPVFKLYLIKELQRL